ncbi:uncharacterized protein LOC112091554 [Morus notabilis]|uniref:uncharacterized protein LOC112091554 n=1 Tax=Morus notabilis TaxID=981085 RepID=UPI000CED7D1A|nr:uncharacterized protein LOC112091554 [Morus notabilis]
MLGVKNLRGLKGNRKRSRDKKVADASELLAKATKDCNKVMETAESTPSAPKQSQQNLTEALVGVATRFSAPQDQTHENSVQVECTKSAPQKDLSSTQPHVQVKSETSNDDLVDFRGLAMLPRCHAALLEEACLDHPDLAICSGSRTSRWRHFAYETLGELLFFLHSTRRREMTEEMCKRLKGLWKEAQLLGFDLSWLSTTVTFGLSASSHLEWQREGVLTLENQKRHLNEERDSLRCQLSTLTMRLCQNERDSAALEKQFLQAKANLKLTEEAFLCVLF